ncbi:MAG: hypothetical protein EZS28_054694, partial [Streblomastix strix]
ESSCVVSQQADSKSTAFYLKQSLVCLSRTTVLGNVLQLLSALGPRDLARHLKYCQGPEKAKQVKLDHLPKPYYPHIQNNKLLQKLVATGQSDLLNPKLNYITFDFETVENIINEDNVLAQLEPLSVSSAATINDQITMLYFDLRNGTDFIEQWISLLFEVAIKVNEAIQSNIPDVTIDEHQREA